MARDTKLNPWTREELLAALWKHKEKGQLEKAMAKLLARQTADEVRAENTHHLNGRGFSAFHVKTGTKLGKYALRGGKFGPVWQSQAYRIAKVHIGQLVDIANGSEE